MPRKPSPDKEDARRQQAPKQIRGIARGHGVHHRHQPGREAPHPFGTGRDRTSEGARRKDLARWADDELAELGHLEERAEGDKRLEELGEAGGFGAPLEGVITRGLVLEVRKGNFLTRMLASRPETVPGSAAWQAGDILRTFVRGTLQQFDLGLASLVAPGDEIELIVPPLSARGELFQAGLHGVLTKVLTRKNEFRRLHPSGRAIQTLAANVDLILVMASAAEPDFRPGFVDRVLVCAAACNIPAALVLNKIDLGVRAADEQLLAVYRRLGLSVFRISLRDAAKPEGEMAELKRLLAGARTVLSGHSGVGKSTLLLALDPALSAAQVRTAEVSAQTSKGVHTTTHACLYQLVLGVTKTSERVTSEVIDTPGVREFTPADTDRRNLWGWFPELVRLQGQCGFADCTHTSEKHCAVLAAVERGEIHPRRHQSYVRIYETLTG